MILFYKFCLFVWFKIIHFLTHKHIYFSFYRKPYFGHQPDHQIIYQQQLHRKILLLLIIIIIIIHHQIIHIIRMKLMVKFCYLFKFFPNEKLIFEFFNQMKMKRVQSFDSNKIECYY